MLTFVLRSDRTMFSMLSMGNISLTHFMISKSPCLSGTAS